MIVKLEQITSKIDTNAFNCKCNGTYSNIVIDKSRESEAQIGTRELKCVQLSLWVVLSYLSVFLASHNTLHFACYFCYDIPGQ